MTKNLTRAEAAGFLLAHDNFTILTHRRPDGDTLGSAAALCLGLRKLGKHAWVLNPTEPLDHLDWLLADITKDFADNKDTIVYDLTIQGAHEANDRLPTQDDIYVIYLYIKRLRRTLISDF